MKLHVEVTLLAPETITVKKKKRTTRAAAWVVFEGHELRGAGRMSDDPKGMFATSAGRMFAAALHLAHGKLVDANSIDATVSDGNAPKPKAERKTKAKPNGEPAPARKGKKKAAANGEAEATKAADHPAGETAEAATAEAERPAKAAKPKAPKQAKKAAKGSDAEPAAE